MSAFSFALAARETRIGGAVAQALTLATPIAILAGAVLAFGGSAYTVPERAATPPGFSLAESAGESPAAVYYLVRPLGAPALDAAEWMAGGALDNVIVITGPEHEAAVLRYLKAKNDAYLAAGRPGIAVVNLLSP
ncbi:MAG TPA: hypothetical protein VNN10_15225 [Dehalococcoidia bacterium]|nr:hypothetical protein [Dehalococcoidia bacterium]